MYIAVLSAVALAATCVSGYENSSPLFIYSTSHQVSDAWGSSTPDLTSAESLSASLQKLTALCPTKNYLVVSQPGVSTSDFSCPRNAPLLKERLSATDKGQSSIQIREIINTINAHSLAHGFAQDCSKSVQTIDVTSMMIPKLKDASDSKVFNLEFPALQENLTPEERHVVLLQHDTYVESLIDTYFNNKDYTLVYTTTSVHAAKNQIPASESEEYQAELPVADMMHSGELRRSLSKRNESSSGNQTIIDGPLFDKYQFLSPGIFMGLFVGFILLSILYVGTSALASLQVTYGAFDKEQGQLAAKKAQ